MFSSCKDENVLQKSELISTQACENYLLIEYTCKIEQAFRDNGISKDILITLLKTSTTVSSRYFRYSNS